MATPPVAAPGEGEPPGRGCAEGDAIADEGGSVVDEALPLDQVDHPPGDAQATHDGGGRHRVGGRDDGAKDEGHGPGQVEDGMREGRHRGHRGQNETDRRQRQGAGIRPQCPQVGEERGHVEQRGQKHQQDQLGIELDAWAAGDGPDDQPTQHQDDGIRNPEPAGHGVQAGHRDQQGGQDDLEPFHASIIAGWGLVRRSAAPAIPSVKREPFHRRVHTEDLEP
jgi:hypothetical protein